MGKNPLILVFNYTNQGGPVPEMQLIVKFLCSFIPSLIHSKCQYNQQCHSALLLTKGRLVENHWCPGEMV